MEILKQRPPNFAEIVKVFRQAGSPGVIFAYAPNIYAPTDTNLPPDLVEHEKVHIRRQEEIGVELWWESYLANPEFRYHEELLAHRAEYRFLIANCANRNTRRMALKHVAKKLASGLYKNMVSKKAAADAIAFGVMTE